MFMAYFNFFLDCIKQVFDVMRKFVLFGNFTFFDFSLILIFVSVFIHIIKFVEQRDGDK